MIESVPPGYRHEPSASNAASVIAASAAFPDEIGFPDKIDCSSMMFKAIVLVTIVIPLVGFMAGIALLWGFGFRWLDLCILVAMYVLTGMGIGIGYHRLFTHRAFETGPVIRCVVGVLGSMAAQGPILNWVATHRRHHQHSDDAQDPHSPNLYGENLRGSCGYWHAHAGWLFQKEAFELGRQVGDLQKDAVVRFVSATFPLWVILGLVVPAAVGGLLTMSWMGALMGFIWGGLIRLLLVHHVTWSINSACHVWGTRPFRSGDESRNNALFGVLAFGEGWHNNHHAFPTSARHGLRWWQIDLNYIVIRGLEIAKLAWRVRVPAPAAMQIKRRRRSMAAHEISRTHSRD